MADRMHITAVVENKYEKIPESLRTREQWIVWREEEPDGKPTKVPRRPDGTIASTTDPNTWTPFEAACDSYRDNPSFDGIGFVFTEEDPFVGVDIDICFSEGVLTGGGLDVVEHLDSYTERSPSGTGLHIICRGSTPDLGNRSGDVEGMKQLEVYEEGRYFTFTGRHLEGTPDTVEQRAQELYTLCRKVFEQPEPQSSTSRPPQLTDLDDRELIKKAKAAKNGRKFERLWGGDKTGYKSHSEADLALVGILAYWTGGDRDRIDQLFRRSGLCRDKWTERRDYRDRTIDKALEGQTEHYEPSSSSEKRRTNGHAQDVSDTNLDRSHVFWYVDENKEKVKIDRTAFLHFLQNRGFGKLYEGSDLKSTLIRVDDHVVRRTSIERIKDFTLNHVRSIPADKGLPLESSTGNIRLHEGFSSQDVVGALLRGANVYFSGALFDCLQPLDLEFH